METLEEFKELYGIYELHNTIALKDENDSVKFNEFCATYKLKPIHVLILYNHKYLSENHLTNLGVGKNTNKLNLNGYTPIILFQTSKYVTCKLSEAFNELKKITKLLQANNYIVIREKIEAVRSSIKQKLNHKDIYHETHIVVNCVNYEHDTIKKLDELNVKANQFNIDSNNLYVPLSFNSKKYEENQVFITLRNYESDLDKTHLILEQIIDDCKDVISDDFRVIKTINETVLYDSNAYVDVQKKI
jgi:hypothetical protein